MKRRPTKTPAAFDLDAALAGVATMNVEQLRDFWRQTRGQEPPPAFSKDLIARALAYWLQEEVLGGLEPRVRKLLGASSSEAGPPPRHVKVGSVIVREYQGELHELLVVSNGQIFASLSTIARTITGTSWNGPASSACAAGRRHPQPMQRLRRGRRQIHGLSRDPDRSGRSDPPNIAEARHEACRAEAAALRHLYPQIDRA